MTEYENKAFFTLAHFLRAHTKVSEIHKNVRFASGGKVFRPDFFIPNIGLAIEIIGKEHFKDHKMRRDAQADELAKALGISILQIPPEWFHSISTGNARVSEITNFLLKKALDRKELLKQSLTVNRGRATAPWIIQEHKARANAPSGVLFDVDRGIGYVAKPFYGGFRVFLRRKLKRKNVTRLQSA